MLWRAAARRFSVLAIRDFRLLLIDRLLAPFSIGFSIVGVSFAVLKVTGSTADLSYVIAAQKAASACGSCASKVISWISRALPSLSVMTPRKPCGRRVLHPCGPSP